jgi:hypothetical protein
MIVQACLAFDRAVGVDVDLHMLTPGCSKNDTFQLAPEAILLR